MLLILRGKADHTETKASTMNNLFVSIVVRTLDLLNKIVDYIAILVSIVN